MATAEQIQTACESLRIARENRSLSVLDILRDEFRQFGLTPKDVGTTQEELDGLRRACQIQSACESLRIAREMKNLSILDILESELSRFQLTPEDVGTTREEIDKLRKLLEA